ncbi:hypothetical protein BDB01DRAFT_787496 [Pilobolus umbonatus]|nr:hypothetical protein BDB01DRAFT_787496 [Pilobolus umbonatus]
MSDTHSNKSMAEYISYQQQYNNSMSYHTNDTVSIVLFFAIISLLFLSFLLYFWYTERHKIPITQRGDQAILQQEDMYLLMDNIVSQIKTTFRIPIITLLIVIHKTIISKQQGGVKEASVYTAEFSLNSHEHQRVYASRYYHILSLVLLLTFSVSLFILIVAISKVDSSLSLIPATLFVFVISINLYLITRQCCYYKERRKLYGTEDAHINAIYDTCFSGWDPKMWSNWIQIAILIIEFIQLMTFPLRDLMHVTYMFSDSNANGNKSSEIVSLILNAGGLMPDMRTPTWYMYSLWTAFTGTFLSLIVGIVIHFINLKYPYKINTRWIRWFIPVATLLYIPILTAFVSSAACQSLNKPVNAYSRTLRCNSPTIIPPLYFWLSLIGYLFAYFMLTIFLTSHERLPRKNEIAYKSISIAFIKNMGLLLAIVYLLVESTTHVNRMRSILSIIIILTMICYNIKIRPCYVDKINFFRTASFTCILWTSALVAILSDTHAAQSLGPLTVIYIIIGGWILITLLFIIIYFIYYLQPKPIQHHQSTVRYY